MRKIELIF